MVEEPILALHKAFYGEVRVDYKALSLAVEGIWAQSEEIGVELKKKFDDRQKSYEEEIEQLKPSGRQMKQAFNL